MKKIKPIIYGLRDSQLNNSSIEDIETYLNFYNLEYHHVEHQYEFIECSGGKIFVQSFTPSSPVGVIYVVHGYFDHTGSMSNLINYLTRSQYQVITYDLQGHGLSTGDRATITDFSEYVKTFKDIYDRKKGLTSLPLYTISHSTGGAITMEYLFQYGSPFQKIILVSPLIRSYAWILSKVGFTLVNPFVNELHRVFKSNSSNRKYLQFVKKDPLQYNKIPLDWIKSLMVWNERIRKYPKLEEKLFVIQGNQDRTVDWKHNLNFIREKFPNCKVRIVNGGNHQLFNEEQPLLQKTFEYIDEVLKEKG